MGLLDYLGKAYESGMSMLAPNQQDVEMRPRIAKGLLEVLPTPVSDALSGYEAYQSAKQGDLLGAGLNGVGMLPFIPSMAGVVSNKSLDAVLDVIRQKHNVDIGAHTWPMGVPEDQINGVYVGRVVVPKEMRGEGRGTKAMQELLDYTDSEKAKTFLTADLGLGATSKDRLKNFYKNLGYKENKGRTHDFSISGNMIREPK